MSKMKNFEAMTKKELVTTTRELERRRVAAVDAFANAKERLLKVAQERADVQETLKITNEKLGSTIHQKTQMKLEHDKYVAECRKTDTKQKLDIDKIRIVMMGRQKTFDEETAATNTKLKLTIDEMRIVTIEQQEAFRQVEIEHTTQQVELIELRSTLFHPALLTCLYAHLDAEKRAGKKEKIEKLIGHLGKHMTFAAAQDPDIWRLMAEELY